MKKIISDCDNTFGVPGCDLDDGLAIIYSLGTMRCELLGVTTTFGNNAIDVVYPNTVKFMKNIGRSDIPVLSGHENNAEKNEAARFLVDTVALCPGEVSILATGSVTNLYHAWLLDPRFFENVQSLSFMGGITEPLVICGKKLDELNFACNSLAAFNVLTHGNFISIATGNNCLRALFTRERFDSLQNCENDFLKWLNQQGQYWFHREREVFGHDGIYKWDVYAAAALLCPEFFDENITVISPDLDSLKSGMLLGQGVPKKVALPKLKDSQAYVEHVYESYTNFASLVSDLAL